MLNKIIERVNIEEVNQVSITCSQCIIGVTIATTHACNHEVTNGTESIQFIEDDTETCSHLSWLFMGVASPSLYLVTIGGLF